MPRQKCLDAEGRGHESSLFWSGRWPSLRVVTCTARHPGSGPRFRLGAAELDPFPSSASRVSVPLSVLPFARSSSLKIVNFPPQSSALPRAVLDWMNHCIRREKKQTHQQMCCDSLDFPTVCAPGVRRTQCVGKRCREFPLSPLKLWPRQKV